MEKKEFHRRHLPHFQQPGQAYFVTWSLKDAVPAKALQSYTLQLKDISLQIENAKTNKRDKELIRKLKIDFSIVRKSI